MTVHTVMVIIKDIVILKHFDAKFNYTVFIMNLNYPFKN